MEGVGGGGGGDLNIKCQINKGNTFRSLRGCSVIRSGEAVFRVS